MISVVSGITRRNGKGGVGGELLVRFKSVKEARKRCEEESREKPTAKSEVEPRARLGTVSGAGELELEPAGRGPWTGGGYGRRDTGAPADQRKSR